MNSGLHQNSLFDKQNLLPNLADNLVFKTKELSHQAKTEEDLRIGFEKLLEPILKELGIKLSPRYERTIYNAGRPDALHGKVVIEYELPFAFRSFSAINHAKSQLVGYIQGLSDAEKESLFLFEAKFIGVGFDGEQIFFIRYKRDFGKAKTELEEEDFSLIGPYHFNENSARTLLTHLRALARLPLTADNLANKLGPKSELAPKAVSAFADALEYWGDQTRVRTLYNEWIRLFGIVYGEQFGGYQARESEALANLYKVGKETDFQELLFSIHTYFAFIMKLIAAELLTLKDATFISSLASELAHLPEDELKKNLEDIEDGGVYARKGVTNFLEGDFFRWYLDAWSPRLKEAIQEIARTLSEFEPATSIIAPSATRDLLKRLYQFLVPQEVRHRLGEYYTPDWLAELLLNEVGYKGNTRKRLLDPACGSGTFLVLAVQRAKEHGMKEKLPPLETAKRIKENIWGFDLNPLAVIAARTNYLFAMGDLVNELENLEIPIYLADSVLWPEQVGGQNEFNFHGVACQKISTSIKDFYIPSIWIKNKGFLMKDAAPLMEKFVKEGFESEIAMKHLRDKGLVFPPFEKVVENFYQDILELEKQNKNGIWARFLKNAFAPMAAGKFDFVVGNPPWVRWGYLSKEYREATLHLWKDYGLFSLKGHAARLGGGEKDFSMLYVYTAADYYLKDKAKLGFLITQEVFKSKGAGEGFRRFQLGDKEYLKALKAHDLASVQPFEGAANKTALVILQKGKKTKYPVPYLVWTKKKGVGKIATNKCLDEVSPLLLKKALLAKPIGAKTGAWQTISESQVELGSIEGKNSYQALRGASTEPYGVFWLEVRQVLSDGNIIIRNLTERGKREVQKVEERIEPDLVYPAVSGADIERWRAISHIYVLMSQDPATRNPFPVMVMKSEWPRTYGYLTRFRNILLSRGSTTIRQLAERTAFYAMFGISSGTVANYKVVWKRMSNDLIGAVISQHKTPFGYKTVIPTDTTSLFHTDNEPEAHYLCAIINSNPVREFIKSFSSAGRGFGSPSVMEHVGIPKFDPENALHQELSDISKKCHQLKSEGKDKEIEKLEKENDELVKKLFNIR